MAKGKELFWDELRTLETDIRGLRVGDDSRSSSDIEHGGGRGGIRPDAVVCIDNNAYNSNVGHCRRAEPESNCKPPLDPASKHDFQLITAAENIGSSRADPNLAKKTDVSCVSICVYSSIVIVLVCAFLFAGRNYIKYVLLALEQSNFYVGILIFAALFAAVSFPLTWGYILLNIAAGYLYGVMKGLVVAMLCALCGVVLVHIVIRRYLRQVVWDRLANDTMRAIIRVVESGSGFKVIVLARLTPIPFGLQNALFAMSKISIQRYLFASMAGILPSQGLHVYIGSTFRSMEEVITSSHDSSLACFIFGCQLVMAGALLTFVVYRARVELNRTLEVAQNSPTMTDN